MKPFREVMPDGTVVTGRVQDDAPPEYVRDQAMEQWRRTHPDGPAAARAKEIAADPYATVKLLVGLREPESLRDWVVLAAGGLVATSAGGLGAGALAARVAPSVARAAPLLGSALTSGLITGGRELASGRGGATDALQKGALDAVVSGMLSGAPGVLAHMPIRGHLPVEFNLGLKAAGAPVRAYEWATRAPHEAVAMLSKRLSGAGRHVNVPSLSPTPMTFQDAVNKLVGLAGTKGEGLHGQAYRLARDELAGEMTRLDLYPGMKDAGKVFLDPTVTSEIREVPRMGAKIAEGARKASTSRAAQIGIATGAQMPSGEPGVTMGELAAKRLFLDPIERVGGLVSGHRRSEREGGGS